MGDFHLLITNLMRKPARTLLTGGSLAIAEEQERLALPNPIDLPG